MSAPKEDSPFCDTITITVCGDGGTGKSSISLRLVRCKWTHEYDPTIQDFYSVTRVVDGRTYQLNLTDTAGQEEYRGLWAASNLNADAYLLVYDITNSESLAALDYFDDLIELDTDTRQQPFPPVKIVAGNKCDLAQSRQVSAADGLAWARDHGCGFMETSARNMVNIEETFQLLVRRVVQAREAAANGTLQPYSYAKYNDGHGTVDTEKQEAAVSEAPKPAEKKKPWYAGGCCTIC